MIPFPSDRISWKVLRESFQSSLPHDAATSVGVVVGCSGGADSVALTHLIAEQWRSSDRMNRTSRPPLRLAHFNHCLRGEQSEGDEQFVRDLARSLEIEMEVGRPPMATPGDDEASLRQDRRDFFHSVAARSGCRYIALAHTADDQAETILHHLLRGTGSQGLMGMRQASPMGSDFVILRPLLKSRRDEVRSALIEREQPWREDASNLSTRYTRNWIRHDVLPLIRTRLPNADMALTRAAENQQQVGAMVTHLAQQWMEAFVELPDEQASATQTLTLTIQRPCGQRGARSPRPWPHGDDLAIEPVVIIAACQIAFDSVGFPRRDMNRHHWERLVKAITETVANTSPLPDHPPTSLGHWPGHIEGFQTNDQVLLRMQK